MPKGTNQKLKLYYLAKIMLSKTDEEHFLTMPQIIDELEKYEVTAERKSLYNDLEDLEKLGIIVEGEADGRSYHYHVVGHSFELPELKLLVDAIQSSKFITGKKTKELIAKLESFVSEYEAKELQRQVYVSGRIKSMNESIYYNVDEIHRAINDNKKISFQYFQWNVQKKMELRHNGAFYNISPWGLSWDDENYYLVGYDSEAQQIRHYRVDKMLHITMSEENREGRDHFKMLNMADYSRKSFGMFGGEEEEVTLRVRNEMAGVIIDRFGKDVMIRPESPGKDNGFFVTHVDVNVSNQFFSWICALGDGAVITAPVHVVEQMKEFVRKLNEQYGIDS